MEDKVMKHIVVLTATFIVALSTSAFAGQFLYWGDQYTTGNDVGPFWGQRWILVGPDSGDSGSESYADYFKTPWTSPPTTVGVSIDVTLDSGESYYVGLYDYDINDWVMDGPFTADRNITGLDPATFAPATDMGVRVLTNTTTQIILLSVTYTWT
jgi:hypothetical protein